MREFVAIRFGMKKSHPINEDWFSAIGIRKSYPFNIFSSKSFLKSYPLFNQLLGFFHSLFLPNAKNYILTSTGCMSSVILKKILFKSKVIVINSDTFYKDLKDITGFKKKYMLWLISFVDLMISTSNQMVSLSNPYLKESIKNKVIYLYGDINKFSKVNGDLNSKDICAIGAGINTKGTDILFEAFTLYQKIYPKSKLYLCGDLNDISNLTIPKNVITPGIIDPSIYLKKSSICINTSRHESFGVNILEGMLSSNVVFASKFCGASEILQKIDSRLVITLTPSKISNTLIDFQKDITLKKTIVKKSKKLALSFTKEKSLSLFKLEIYNFCRK